MPGGAPLPGTAFPVTLPPGSAGAQVGDSRPLRAPTPTHTQHAAYFLTAPHRPRRKISLSEQESRTPTAVRQEVSRHGPSAAEAFSIGGVKG